MQDWGQAERDATPPATPLQRPRSAVERPTATAFPPQRGHFDRHGSCQAAAMVDTLLRLVLIAVVAHGLSG
ncbi:hypothetical protein, partial [Pelomicrobium sp.]|uniref:hypothetical protein n=1 Tax=Pelomicrobium sp. TaxID=2815319 RepID=UPI002FDED50D